MVVFLENSMRTKWFGESYQKSLPRFTMLVLLPNVACKKSMAIRQEKYQNNALATMKGAINICSKHILYPFSQTTVHAIHVVYHCTQGNNTTFDIYSIQCARH